jgi:hypothetical protein
VSAIHVDEAQTTIDFSKLYDNLALSDVRHGVCEAIKTAAKELQRRFACNTMDLEKVVFTAEGTWERVPAGMRKKPRHWNITQIMDAVRDLIDNSFVYANGRMYHQTLGIGIGHEPMPAVANLYLFSREQVFIDSKLRSHGREGVKRIYDNFRGYLRYIDDLYAPKPLELLPEPVHYDGLAQKLTGQGDSVVFLGIRATRNGDGQVTCTAYDKQASFNFPLIRYPSAHSSVPRSIATGCIIGALCRVAAITTFFDYYVKEVTHQLKIFVGRGYALPLLKTALYKFSRRRVEAASRTLFCSTVLSLLQQEHPIEPAQQPSQALPVQAGMAVATQTEANRPRETTMNLKSGYLRRHRPSQQRSRRSMT